MHKIQDSHLSSRTVRVGGKYLYKVKGDKSEVNHSPDPPSPDPPSGLNSQKRVYRSIAMPKSVSVCICVI